jgi:hypothetical protein
MHLETILATGSLVYLAVITGLLIGDVLNDLRRRR